jgi:hypothetical protein
MIPNILVGALVLGIGYLIAQRLKRHEAAGEARLPEHTPLR